MVLGDILLPLHSWRLRFNLLRCCATRGAWTWKLGIAWHTVGCLHLAIPSIGAFNPPAQTSSPVTPGDSRSALFTVPHFYGPRDAQPAACPAAMALPRPGCGPCGQPHQRRRLLGLTACIVVLLLAAPWLRMVGAAAYAVAWWSLAPQVQWARPGSAAAPAPAAAPVPKLMHQTWQTKQVPAKWAAARQSCLDLHPDFEHRLWTDEEGLAFIKVRAGLAAARRSRQAPGRRLQPGRPIGRLWSHKRAPGGAVATQRAAADACPDASTLCSSTGQTRSAPPCLRPVPQKHYPWFLPTYVAYPYSIQRVDVLRYFLLHHYGGIYIDLDSEWHFEAGAAGSWRERAVPAGVFPCCTVLFATRCCTGMPHVCCCTPAYLHCLAHPPRRSQWAATSGWTSCCSTTSRRR